ncbi:DUF732 domain-containing protein [Mycobacterium sp.]|uniref:DUF732 domain-containing protein n=1 Tax=Mycobacterium sp. TaxID=1785 RepID=UPI003D12798B
MRLLIGLVSAAAIVGLAVPALADPPPDPNNSTVPPDPAADAHFIDSLSKAGMTFRNGSDAVAAGRYACDMMNQGAAETDVVSKLSMLNPGLNNAGAMKFAALASSTYCPDYLSKSSTPTKSSGGLGGLFGGH